MKITEANLNNIIENNNLVLKFGHEQCMPCKMLEPIIEKIQSEDKNYILGTIDTREYPEITQHYGIRNVPAILFFKNGQVVDKMIGITSEMMIRDKISEIFDEKNTLHS